MSVSFLAAAAAALVTVVITGILVRRLARLPRLHMVAWALAAAGMTIALAAMALGFHRGFNPSAFRAVQIGARVAAPMALAWGLTELVGKSFAARFAGRLALAALTVIAGVILVADPLSGVTFTTAWPAAADHYQLIPTKVLAGLAAVTALWAVAALGFGGVRAQRQPPWRDALPAVAAAAVAILLTEGFLVRLPVKSGYAALCLAVAALTWFAGQRAGRLRLGALHEVPDMGDTGWRDRYTDDTGFGYQDGAGWVSGDADFGGLYRPGSGRVGDADFGGLYRPDTGEFRDTGPGEHEGFPHTGDIGSDAGYGFYRTDTDLRPVLNGEADRRGEPLPGIVETGDVLPVAFDVFTPADRAPHDDQTGRLFGQIAIYTLLDGRAEEFDRLAQQVVEKVKALEPDTLAYIVHGVPAAPMQRILYEVYRDVEAYEEHCRQPYIQDFEEDRQPLVLATNVIELGVQQAKLSPLSGQDVPPSAAGMAGREGTANGTGPPPARPASDPRQHRDSPPRAEDSRASAGSRHPGDPSRSDSGRQGGPPPGSGPGWQGDPRPGSGPGWQGDPRPGSDPLPGGVPRLPEDLADHPRLAGRSGVYGRPRPASPPPDPAGRRDNGSR